MASQMRATMERQPEDLRRLLGDTEPVKRAAVRLTGRRVYIVGTGTSWHAANHGAWLLREAGVDAVPVPAFDAALWGPRPQPEDGLILLSHTGAKRYSLDVLAWADRAGVATVTVGAIGTGYDLETVEKETADAYTASHLGALMRLAQLTQALGGDLGDLEAVPDAVAAALQGPGPGVAPPKRLLEFIGAGPNQWTAAEGALKVRETCFLATEGLGVEQFFHGPSVAMGEGDALVALDGGGPGASRLAGVADAAEQVGVTVHRVSEPALGEPLSVFPLTVAVQRVALECAEALGANPDNFGYDLPGHEQAWEPLGF
jgi:glutamine---fructose-6-phosphate transaminase (isomerizing)